VQRGPLGEQLGRRSGSEQPIAIQGEDHLLGIKGVDFHAEDRMPVHWSAEYLLHRITKALWGSSLRRSNEGAECCTGEWTDPR
jgi:hypothetical protein